MRQDTASATLKQLSTALVTHIGTDAVQQMRDLFTDASVALWLAARPLLDGVMCARDKEAPLVATLLESIHATFDAVDLHDAIMRYAPTSHTFHGLESSACTLYSRGMPR